MKNGISVVVCCYNSERRLPITLNHLINQKQTDFDWEVIVVDNASTDGTFAISKEILSKVLPADKFKIVTEKNPGLSNARKRGYLTSQYNYLVFCDDDNWLNEDYLRIGFQQMEKNHSIGILGGKGEAVFEKAKPKWFDNYQINFAVGPQSSDSTEISETETVYGAGFIVRKKIFETLDAIGFQSILSDRKGNDLMSGGDTELCYVCKYLGYKVAYSDKLRFKHFMANGRMSWEYLKKLYTGFGKMRLYTHAYKLIEENPKVPGESLRLPLWLDRYIHLLKEVTHFLPYVLFRINNEGDDYVLKYFALLAELKELRTIRNNYSKIFSKILDLRLQILLLRKN